MRKYLPAAILAAVEIILVVAEVVLLETNSLSN